MCDQFDVSRLCLEFFLAFVVICKEACRKHAASSTDIAFVLQFNTSAHAEDGEARLCSIRLSPNLYHVRVDSGNQNAYEYYKPWWISLPR